MATITLKSNPITNDYDCIQVINDGYIARHGVVGQIFSTKNIVRDQLSAMTYILDSGEQINYDKSYVDFLVNSKNYHRLNIMGRNLDVNDPISRINEGWIEIIAPNEIVNQDTFDRYLQQNYIYDVPLGYEEMYFIKVENNNAIPLFLKIPMTEHNRIRIFIEDKDQRRFFGTEKDIMPFSNLCDYGVPEKIETSNGILYYVRQVHKKGTCVGESEIKRKLKNRVIMMINHDLNREIERAIDVLNKTRNTMEIINNISSWD